MPLTPAKRLGPYEIVAPLGAGGMGEVYRARDSRLGREVALKVLPAEVSGDPARRARLEQEARAAAALSHPNIVGLFDVGDLDGCFFTVSELVPGETLAAILDRGPLPTRKLLDLAAQIADGMAAAHAAGIAHRDLKPANIIVTPEGRAKILDFGLAKRSAFAAARDETITVHQTEPGMILGTIHYMSPEQARGKPADYRSDQFSFGVILYEMATGRKAFDKPESVQTMSAILTEDPPPIDRNLPPPFQWALERCLAKDPADRYESSRDLARQLRQIRDYAGESSSASQVSAPAPAVRAPRRLMQWLLPAIAVVALVAAFALGRSLSGPRFPDQSAYRFTPFAFDPGAQTAPVWSPDGKAVAYARRDGGPGTPYQLMVRYLDAAMGQPITTVADDAIPVAWAPDSMRIVFSSRRAPAGLWSISVTGGEPESFFPLPDNNVVAVSPDLRSVAMLRRGDDGVYAMWISSPPGAAPQKYTADPVATRALYNDTRMRFSPDGKNILLFMKGDRGADETWLMPYPPSSSHPPKLVLPNLPTYGGTPMFAWMPDSRRVILSLSPAPTSSTRLWLADLASNHRIALTSGTTYQSTVAVSPDGAKLVFTEGIGSYDVVSVDLDLATAERFIATERDETMPAWAANDRSLVYVTDRDGPYEIWFRNHAGDRPLVRQRDFPPGTTQWFTAPSLSPDGARVVYSRTEYQGTTRLWMSSVTGGAPVRLTNDATSTEYGGAWSPDASWFAYLAIRNGKMDLMKVKASGQAAPALVYANPGCLETPSWSPAGDWIQCGSQLISPDGQASRKLPVRHTQNYVFSKDGKLLYGLRDDPDHEVLFSVNVATGFEKTLGNIGREFRPNSNFHPALRFSLSPDGKSFVYPAGTFHSNLWMLTGALAP